MIHTNGARGIVLGTVDEEVSACIKCNNGDMEKTLKILIGKQFENPLRRIIFPSANTLSGVLFPSVEHTFSHTIICIVSSSTR